MAVSSPAVAKGRDKPRGEARVFDTRLLEAALWFGLAMVIPLEHDPEKWDPVFGKDHAPTNL
jgi:hypothetical protein